MGFKLRLARSNCFAQPKARPPGTCSGRHAGGYKIVGNLLLAQLKPIKEGLPHEPQCGFRPERGCTDATFSLKQALRKRREHGLESWSLFIDLLKAFNRVLRELLCGRCCCGTACRPSSCRYFGRCMRRCTSWVMGLEPLDSLWQPARFFVSNDRRIVSTIAHSPAAACITSALGSKSPLGRGGGAAQRALGVLPSFPVVGGRLCERGVWGGACSYCTRAATLCEFA